MPRWTRPYLSQNTLRPVERPPRKRPGWGYIAIIRMQWKAGFFGWRPRKRPFRPVSPLYRRRWGPMPSPTPGYIVRANVPSRHNICITL